VKHTPGPLVPYETHNGQVRHSCGGNFWSAPAELWCDHCGWFPSPPDDVNADLLECLVAAARYICEHACNPQRNEHSVGCHNRAAIIAKAKGAK
jgi:hypothetical protein